MHTYEIIGFISKGDINTHSSYFIEYVHLRITEYKLMPSIINNNNNSLKRAYSHGQKQQNCILIVQTSVNCFY